MECDAEINHEPVKARVRVAVRRGIVVGVSSKVVEYIVWVKILVGLGVGTRVDVWVAGRDLVSNLVPVFFRVEEGLSLDVIVGLGVAVYRVGV